MDIETKIKNNKQYVIYSVFLFVVACRLVSIFFMPDVYKDEAVILSYFNAFISGENISNNINNLFFPVGAGLTTYTYFYPMLSILSIMGVGVFKARIIQQVLTIFACLFLSLAIKIWANDNKKLFWIVLFVSLTIPWGFVQANRIWDPSFVPLFFSIYFLFFSLLMKKENLSDFKKYFYSVISFSFLVFLAIVYPPCRISAVLIWVISLFWGLKTKRINYFHSIVIIIVSSLLSIPLAYNLLFNPYFNARSAKLLIFNGNRFMDALYLFVMNFLSLINPIFLFFGGDVNYRHSLPIFGIIGTISIIPLLSLVIKRNLKDYSICIFSFFIIIVSFISTALTKTNMPHSLRACLCWMPFSILISYGWYSFLKGKSFKSELITYIAMLAFFVIYFIGYIVIFKYCLFEWVA